MNAGVTDASWQVPVTQHVPMLLFLLHSHENDISGQPHEGV